jgi:hypothetical protein
VHNITLLKDHLKLWCNENKVAFGGDVLINTNESIGIIHDLWNIQKHGKLNKSRSGITPELRNYTTMLMFGPSDGPMSLQLDPTTGQMINHGAELVLSVEVYDEYGNKVGQLHNICREAIDVWHQELLTAGVSIPLF